MSLTSDAVTAPQQFISGKPNIILIIMNDFGFEIPTYNGGQSYSTPELDNIDATGIGTIIPRLMQFPRNVLSTTLPINSTTQ